MRERGTQEGEGRIHDEEMKSKQVLAAASWRCWTRASAAQLLAPGLGPRFQRATFWFPAAPPLLTIDTFLELEVVATDDGNSNAERDGPEIETHIKLFNL